MVSRKKQMARGWVILWIILFFPVGIFLLFRRWLQGTTDLMANSKKVIIGAYVFLVLAALYSYIFFVSELTRDTDSGITMLITFGGSGLWAFLAGKKMQKRGIRYQKYRKVVINQGVTQIDNIAASVGVTYGVARIELQDMIDNDYFLDAYINENTRTIMLEEPYANTQQAPPQQATQPQAAQTRVVACKSCGANNTLLAGHARECEYCGSPID